MDEPDQQIVEVFRKVISHTKGPDIDFLTDYGFVNDVDSEIVRNIINYLIEKGEVIKTNGRFYISNRMVKNET